ncbi:MAG: hypothetical protein ACE5ID_09915, partial [Acidobacteriota bacterium]
MIDWRIVSGAAGNCTSVLQAAVVMFLLGVAGGSGARAADPGNSPTTGVIASRWSVPQDSSVRTAAATSHVSRPAAIISSLKGRVWVLRAGTTEEIHAQLAMALRSGDTLRTELNSSASILTSDDSILTLAAGSKIAMDKLSQEQVPVDMPGKTSEILRRGFLFMTKQQVLVPALRGAGEHPSADCIAHEEPSRPTPLSPRNETITTLRPVFYWSGTAGKVRVMVSRYDQEVWHSKPVRGASLKYPARAPRLDAEGSYSWAIEPLTKGTRKSPSVRFHLMDDDELQGMSAFEAEMTKLRELDDGAALTAFFRSVYYREIGASTFTLKALQSLQELARVSDFVAWRPAWNRCE